MSCGTERATGAGCDVVRRRHYRVAQRGLQGRAVTSSETLPCGTERAAGAGCDVVRDITV